MKAVRILASALFVAVPAVHAWADAPVRRSLDFTEDFMGLFDGILGGVVGAEMATVVNNLIEKHGGVQGVVAQLEQQGLGGTVRSWVGTGANQPITADQIHQAFGSDAVKQLAAKVGLSPDVLAAKLSQVLPQAIDKLTPSGAVPKA